MHKMIDMMPCLCIRPVSLKKLNSTGQSGTATTVQINETDPFCLVLVSNALIIVILISFSCF